MVGVEVCTSEVDAPNLILWIPTLVPRFLLYAEPYWLCLGYVQILGQSQNPRWLTHHPLALSRSPCRVAHGGSRRCFQRLGCVWCFQCYTTFLSNDGTYAIDPN
jgi:hypothetical protein